MTTVAYKDGVMAGDTRISNESEIDVSAYRKVYKLRSGALIGFSGTVEHVQNAVNLLRVNPDNFSFPPRDETFEALLVLPDGEVRHYEDGQWYDVDAKYFSIGSGGDAANVAMEMGADPKKAVKIAMKFDKGTGGKIQVVKLTTKDK